MSAASGLASRAANLAGGGTTEREHFYAVDRGDTKGHSVHARLEEIHHASFLMPPHP
jgi:hypothetical protein